MHSENRTSSWSDAVLVVEVDDLTRTIMDKICQDFGYSFVSEVGTGSAGKVVSAIHTVSNKPVALKVGSTPDSQVAAEICSGDNAYAAQVYDTFTTTIENGTTCHVSVQELCLGGNLLPFVHELKDKSEQLNPKDISYVLFCMAQALKVVHAKGYVHQDVKPDNIVVSEYGVAKLVDFGEMASLADIEEDPFESIGGTEGYMAPEVVAFMLKDLGGMKKLGPRGTASDIWSLGATLHALIFSEAETPYDVTADQQSDGTWYVSMSELGQQAMADALFQRMMRDSCTTEEWEVRSFCDLIAAMLSLDPLSRPTAEDILQHPAVQGVTQDTLKGPSSEAWRKVIQPRIDRALQRQSSMMAQTVAPVRTDKLAEDTASSSGSETATGSTTTSTSESEPHLRQHKQPDPEYWRAGHKKCTLLVAEDRKDRVAKLRKEAHAEKLERIAERKARFQRTAQGDERKKCQPAKRPKAKAQKHQPWHKTCNLLTAENRTKRVAKLREDAQAKRVARITERKERIAKLSAGHKVDIK